MAEGDRLLTPNGSAPPEGLVESTPRSCRALNGGTWVYTMTVLPTRTWHHELQAGYAWVHDYLDGLPPQRGVSIQVDYRCRRCMLAMAAIYVNQPERAHAFITAVYGQATPPEMWGLMLEAAQEMADQYGWIEPVG
jgi:hypothetical protein